MTQLIGYARISPADQTTALQLKTLKALGCARIFEETASGARAGRPILMSALDYMCGGDTLVVWKLDRLARSLSQLVETVASIRQRGIELRALQENIDTTSDSGRHQFHVFDSLAEFERDLLRGRTKAGLDAARERGRTGGRPRRLTDADIDTARKLLESEPPVSFSEVARRLKVGPSTLYNYFPADTLPRRLKGHAGKLEQPFSVPA
jgi:DNA invertase Pin-like site-specific DNA recombinase